MAPIFLCACLRIMRERGAKKGSGRDGRKPKAKGRPKVRVRKTAVVGSAKVGRAKLGRAKLRVAERANIGKRILVAKRRQVSGVGNSRGMTGVRMSGPGRSRGIGVGMNHTAIGS